VWPIAFDAGGQISRQRHHETHAGKPDVFRQLVEQVSQAPRLELFGRRQVPGWVVWGNEVERDELHQGVGELLDVEQGGESDE